MCYRSCARHLSGARNNGTVWWSLATLPDGFGLASSKQLLSLTGIHSERPVSSLDAARHPVPPQPDPSAPVHLAMALLSPLRLPTTVTTPRVIGPQPATTPAWRRAAAGPPPQRQTPTDPWAGQSPRRWVPLRSLTDDEEQRPLAPPRLPASRPGGQEARQARSCAPPQGPNAGPPPWPLAPERAGQLNGGGAGGGTGVRSTDEGGNERTRLDWWLNGSARCNASGGSTSASASASPAAAARGSDSGGRLGGNRSYTTAPAAGDSGSGGGGGGGDSGGGGGSAGGGVDGRRTPERVVSEHVGRQQSAAAGQLDPVGARDDRQQPGASTKVDATHGSLPPLDALRPPPAAAAAAGGVSSGGKGSSWGGADSATEDDNGYGGGGGGRASAVPSWVGPTVWAVPCSTVGYGTRAEVVSRLPASIMLLRHAECMTLDDQQAHERVPNHDIPLSECGEAQARLLGSRLRPALEAAGMRLYMYTSPFLRCSETARLLADELSEGGLVSGVKEAVQLREQDWGNFQDPRVQAECKAERLRYGRFYYRFPAGESVADVYDRLTIFQDHLVRDMCAGRFSEDTCVAIVSHGLTLRVFAMRWLHWTVRQFLQVYNIPNAEPVILHKDVHPSYLDGSNADLPFMPHHTKCLYRLTPRALELMRGADISMSTSNGCWPAQALAQRSPGALDREEEERQWADVDGMV
ncbi:hypothetical protein PLESTB_000683400 [Pleodorina starrii]|uniref:Uncharacterized protein n=1 Tax=Pleodorina starrii TaxID=330485 RepID=A0A9W6F1K2_9CHLO|nr:hypothetical protein PLESTB_000683400 [Pleodorina starrii]GLC65177.1 hypothetical protein PLESTF_000260500 [Pleodorina starrii]